MEVINNCIHSGHAKEIDKTESSTIYIYIYMRL